MTKNTRKRFMAIILTLAMVISLIPALTLPVSAATTTYSTEAGVNLTMYAWDFFDDGLGLGPMTDFITESDKSKFTLKDAGGTDVYFATPGELSYGIYSRDDSKLTFNSSISGTYTFTVIRYNDSMIEKDRATATITVSSSSSAPTVSSGSASQVTSTGATLNGTVNANNASTSVTFEYGTTTSYGSSATATLSPVTGSSSTAVSKAITGLTPKTTYHYRVKGVNSDGTTNGLDSTFTTLAAAPTVTTTSPATSITATGAAIAGSVTADGGESVSARGFVYGTSLNPTTADSKANDGTGTGAISASLTGLTPSTTYHVRAYATNSVDTSYGTDVSFTTLDRTVTIAAAQAMSEENLDTNSLTVTIAGDTFIDATLEKANFTLNNPATGLTVESVTHNSGTTCTVALAYDGTDFDANVNNLSLTIAGAELTGAVNLTSNALSIAATVETAPTVTTTSPATSITATGATAGGNVTADGGEAVTERGVVYSTDEHPAINDAGITKLTAVGTTGLFELNLTGLTSNTTYYVRAYAINILGTRYGDDVSFTTAPTYTIGVLTDQTMTTLTAGYIAGTQESKTITITRTGTGDLASLAAALSGTNQGDFIITELAAANLNNGTPSTTFTVKAKDGLIAGTYTATVTVSAVNMTDVSFTVTQVVNGNGGGGSRTPPTQTSGVDILVNGKIENAGTETTTKEGDKTVTTVSVDPGKLQVKLEAEGNNAVVTIPINTKADIVVGALTGQMVKNMEIKEATLEIKTENVSYTLPAGQINIDNVSEQIGQQVELKDIKVSVTIAAPPQDTVRIVRDTANKNSYQILVKPIEFQITCTSGDKTVDVSKFNGYVERTVAIPNGVVPSKITTGIVLNKDGTFSHVPTTIIQINGKYYAKINSLTNSTYSVIYSPKTFQDIEQHWAKSYVNEMGSRLVVTGVDANNFAPDRDITRAEFAAIIVRALGLRETDKTRLFSDVQDSDWFSGTVAKANEYGIVNGMGDGSFKPTKAISREEAMTMIANAMKIAKMDTTLSEADTSQQLGRFNDNESVDSWARSSAAACVKQGVMEGSNGSLRPQSNITRAETATVVMRMLQKAGLI